MKKMKKCFAVIFTMILSVSTLVAMSETAYAQTSSKYSSFGNYSVTGKTMSGYTAYYPTEVESSSTTKFPVITWGNGTAASTGWYDTLLIHLASHGFIIVAADSTMNQTGRHMSNALTDILRQNTMEDSIFYGKIDVENIGATGHSQGGGGTINCGKDSRIKCIAPIAPSPASTKVVKCPMFLIAGSADLIINPILLVQASYDASEVPTIYGTIEGAMHTDASLAPEKMQGYLVAWFSAILKNDITAQSYFCGDNYGLKSDSDWINVQRKYFDNVCAN